MSQNEKSSKEGKSSQKRGAKVNGGNTDMLYRL